MKIQFYAVYNTEKPNSTKKFDNLGDAYDFYLLKICNPIYCGVWVLEKVYEKDDQIWVETLYKQGHACANRKPEILCTKADFIG